MTQSLSPAGFRLTLINGSAAQALFGLLAVAAALVAALEAGGGAARSADAWGCLLAGLLFAALAWAVRAEWLGVVRAQRAGVAALAVLMLSSQSKLWLGGAPAPVDAYAVASNALGALLLTLWMFVCIPKNWAAPLALALAALTALFPWLSNAAADPGLRLLTLSSLLAQAVLCAALYGLAAQVERLASVGRVAGLGLHAAAASAAAAEQSIEQFVSQREAGLRLLLQQSEQAHQLASQRAAELRTMLDAFPGVVFRIEADGTISYCNERAAALLGLQAAELEGRHAHMLLGEEGYRRCGSRNLQIQASGLPVSFETSVRHPDGSLRELLMTQFVVAAGGLGRTVSYQIGVDIAERKRAEATLAQAKAEAERANLAKSRFMSNMSHELRTPLNAVLGLAQMLHVQGAAHDEQQQRHLRAIADAGKDLLALVDETLDLSRIDAGDMRVNCQPVNLTDLVRTVLGTVAALAAAQGVTLAPAPSARNLWVQADPVRLRQVLLNLLSNAIKYNRPGGGVAVRVVRRGADAQLVVQDTGLGMTPQQQAQLFQPFNRLGAEHSGVPGTGIGLSIAHGLVGLMKGRLDVRSQLGVGSEFLVWLPVVDPTEKACRPAAHPGLGVLEEDAGLQGTLLYVEDNEVNVLVFEACLSRRPGLKLHVAKNGAEALALAARERVDLVVLDMNLPDQTGLTLADELRKLAHMAPVPMVLLTADATSQTAQRALNHGIHRVWHKPFDAAMLLHDLDELLKEAATA